MKTMTLFGRAAVRFLRGESGTAAVEYAVLLGVIVATCIAAAFAFQPLAGDHFAATSETVGTYEDP